MDDKWERRFYAIAELFQKVDWQMPAHEIYQQIAQELVTLVPCDSVNIRLLSLVGDEMVGHAFAGSMKAVAQNDYATLPRSVGRMATLFNELQPVVYDVRSPDAKDVQSPDALRHGCSHAATVPLVANDELVGAVDFLFKEGQFDGSDDFIRYLTGICRVVGPIASTLSTSEELTEFRIREESKRIGTELRDNHAQPLSVIALEADKALMAHEEGDCELLEKSLSRVSELSRQSAANMTQEVTLLRTDAQNLRGFSENLKSYLDSFKEQWAMNVNLAIPEQDVIVPSRIANQALHILHGALTNVLRHAHAETTTVTVRESRGILELCVEDDGCGFDTKSSAIRSSGIQTMEERARSVGGKLTIASIIDEGTSVCVDLPIVA